jgi:hypothetical protein
MTLEWKEPVFGGEGRVEIDSESTTQKTPKERREDSVQQ